MGEESKESKKALVASSLINSNQKNPSIAKRKLEYTLVSSAKDDVTEKEIEEVQNKAEENQFDHLYNINSITGLNFDPLKLKYPFYHELLKKKLIEVHEAIHSSPGGSPLPSPDPIPISSHHHFPPHEVDDMVTIEQSQDKNDLLGLFSSQIGSQSGILDDKYSHAAIDSFSDMEIVERKGKTTNNVITIESSDEDRFGTPRNSNRKLKKTKSLKDESPDDFFDLSKKRKKSIKSRVSSDDSSEEEQQNIPKKKNLICTPIIPSKHSRVSTSLQITEKYPPTTDFDSEEIIPETQEFQSHPTPSPLPVPKSPSPGASLSNLLFADELAADIDYSCKICGLYLTKTEEKAHRCITPGSSFIARNIISRSAKKSSPSPPVSLVKKRRHTTRPSFFRNKKFDDEEDVGEDYRIRNSNFDALDDHQTSTSYTPAVLPHDRVYNDVISRSPTERHSPSFNDDTMYHNFQQQQDDDEEEEPWQRGEPTEDFELPPPAPKNLAPQYYNQFPDHEGASSPKKRTSYKYNKGGRGGKGRGKGKGRGGFYRKGGAGKRK